MKKFLGIMMVAIGILISIFSVTFKIKKSMSLSFIGGADGPTSIFLADKVGNSSFIITMIVSILLLIIGIFIIAKKKINSVLEQKALTSLSTTLGYIYNPLTESETYDLITKAL